MIAQLKAWGGTTASAMEAALARWEATSQCHACGPCLQQPPQPCQIARREAEQTMRQCLERAMIAAACRCKPALVQLLLAVAPETTAARNADGLIPIHLAAAALAPAADRVATFRALFQAAPATARVRDHRGRTALELLLVYPNGAAAASLLHVHNREVVLELLRAARHWQPSIRSDLPRRVAEARVDIGALAAASLPPPLLEAALRQALAAMHLAMGEPALFRWLLLAWLLAWMPRDDVERVRTLALCLERAQRWTGECLPPELRWKILLQAILLLLPAGLSDGQGPFAYSRLLPAVLPCVVLD